MRVLQPVSEIVWMVVFMMSFGLFGCEAIFPEIPEENSLLDGPVAGLTHEEQRIHLEGDIAFNDVVFTPETGLGPLFVATSCGSCHPGDGRGHPFVSFIRFGQSDTLGNTFLEQGGPQLQHSALPGYVPEKLPEGATSTHLVAPAVTGLGFLEYVPDQTLLELADPEDTDEDGISGRPNWVQMADYDYPRPNAITNNGKYIGRFGKKGAVYSLLHQTVNAYNEDIGITSYYNPYDTYSGVELDPEVDNQTVHDVVFYLQTLKAPIQRDPENPQVVAGKHLFSLIGCDGCHIPTLKVGDTPIPSLSQKVIHPYTDLLLHDMGPGLDDGYTEGSALTYEWKTPPLWGLGLSKNSQGGTYFLLHDGRARTLSEAILAHGGEARESKERFSELANEEKEQLIAFLESL